MSMLARENPFRVERLHALRFVPADLATAIDLRALAVRALAARRGAVIGPHGSGKTTLVLELAQALRSAGTAVRFVHLSREDSRLSSEWRSLLSSPPRAHEVVLLDGGGDLGWAAFQRVAFACRHARVFVITSHRPGRLPELARTATSLALLDVLLCELLADSPPALRARAHAAFAQHRGNLREVFRELYDVLGA